MYVLSEEFYLGGDLTYGTYSGSIACRSSMAVLNLLVCTAMEAGSRVASASLCLSSRLWPASPSSLWKPRARISLHTLVKPSVPARWRALVSPSRQFEAYRSGLSISKAL